MRIRWLGLICLAVAVLGCGAEPAPDQAQGDGGGGGAGGGMVTSPGAGPIAPVDPYTELGGGGGGAQGQVAKDRAKSAAAKAGQGSLGGYTEGE